MTFEQACRATWEELDAHLRKYFELPGETRFASFSAVVRLIERIRPETLPPAWQEGYDSITSALGCPHEPGTPNAIAYWFAAAAACRDQAVAR